MTDYQEWTVDELQDELRNRDLKVSGTKDELVDRLERTDGDDRDGDDPAGGNGQRKGAENPSLADVVRRIREDLSQVVGLDAERVTGLSRSDDGWRAQVDVVEVRRIPPSTDVLGTYEVTADGEGNLGGVQRVRRFRRSEGDEG